MDLGAVTKILWNRVGNDDTIGVNAMVLVGVPKNALVVGIPAITKLRESVDA